MPTYEYVCESCGYEFERFQSMKDDPIKICPECNKESVRRLIGTGAGIIFKGTGFYETDYKRKSSTYNPETKNNKSTSTSSEKKTEKKTEKKSKNSGGKEAA